MKIREASVYDIDNIYNLVKNVYDEFVAKYHCEEGNNEFYKYIEKPYMALRMKDESVFYIAEHKNSVVGMIEIRNISHIGLLYVHKDYHRQGIAKKLFYYAKDVNKCAEYTVKSSMYAKDIYEKIGFIKQEDDFIETNGLKYMPMIYIESLYIKL